MTDADDRKRVQLVLASVAGRDGIYGTVLVPIALTWTDPITKVVRTRTIGESLVSTIRSALTGAEIGTAGSACK